MLYYRVRSCYDNRPRFKWCKSRPYKYHAGIYVGGELYTKKELEKEIETTTLTETQAATMFYPVEISKRRVYWFFGCRFEMDSDADRRGYGFPNP